MSPGYTFSDGRRIHSAIPELHTLLIETARETMKAGDFIEIGIEQKSTRDGAKPILVESVFARVEAINWPFVDAIVHSKPRFTNHHGVCVGDTISCTDRQILSFLPAGDPETKGWIEFVTERVVEMQRAFLSTLVLNELPTDCFTKCVLDADTTVLIHPLHDKLVGIFVGVNVVELPASDAGSAMSARDATLFHEAAERLGFLSRLPGQIVSTARNQLVLSMDPSASGQQLIDLVFTSIEQVFQETARVPAELPAKGEQP